MSKQGKMNTLRGMKKTGQKHRLILSVQKSIALFLMVTCTFAPLDSWLSTLFNIHLAWLPDVEVVEAAVTPAIKVESFDRNVDTDGSTFTLSNDVGATSSAFIKLNTGTRKTSAGPTGSTGNTAPHIGAVGLVLSDTATVTVERSNATVVKVMGEVWRYEGNAGAANEFIVRDRVAVSLSGSSVSTAISGISDVDNVVPFITGYTINNTSVSNWHDATIAAHMDDSGNLIVSRNNSGTAGTVYVDVVEFTGSNWTVCHGYSSSHDTAEQIITLNTDSDGVGGSTCDVSDWDTATIIEATMEGDSSETGLSDTLALVRPGTTTTSVVFDLQQDSNARNDGEAWIHVLQNDDLVVNRASDANISEGNGSYGTATWPAGATTTADLDTLSLEWFTDTSGVGTAHMRGGLHARITDAAGTIQHWIHRSGNTVGVEYGVVELGNLAAVTETTLVSATSTQETDVDIPEVDASLGGAFVITENSATRNITNITVTESGTIDAQNGLDNIEMYYDLDTTFPYDCASESFTGTSTENQYGDTDDNGFSGANGTASFNETVSISTTQAFCGYVVYDVTDAALDGDTVDITIANPSTDVVASGGPTIGPSSAVSPTGVTTARNAELTQVHYHWLEDDGVEGFATEVEAEDTPATGFANGTINRLRLQVSAEGSTSSVPTTLSLEYATSTGMCTSATGWTTVGATGAAWGMSDSAFFVSDGLDSSDLTPANGGTTNENTTHISPNGALKDTNATLASALTFSTANFLELEFAVEPTTVAVEGTTYCFRVSDSGTALRNYDIYPEGTVSADITVSATSSQVATLNVGAVNAHLGGGFVVQRLGGSRTVTDITVTESGSIDAENNLSDIGLWYDLDTTSPYDCTGESFDGDEAQFGATSTSFSSANGTTTFSGSQNINNTQTMCPYIVLSVGSGASNGETIEISIANPSTDVVVSGSSVGPSSGIGPTGSTTIAGPLLTQFGYHWRNDDGDKSGGGGGASSASGGIENTPISEIAKNTTKRIRILVHNDGTVDATATQYRIEYGTKVTTCANVGSWNEVGVGTAFDMSDSTHLTDGETSFDITVSQGGVTNPSGSPVYEFVNDGIHDTTSETAGITLEGNEIVELEYSVVPTTESGDGTTYCFRVSDAGSALSVYDEYPELTVREKQDFYIQHGSTTITGTSTTLVAGVDYAAPSATSAAFVRITNTQFTGAGENQDDDENNTADGYTAYVTDATDITTSFTLERPSNTANSADTRVYWELVEFTGLAATDNEMIVRDVGEVTYGSGDLHATGTAVSDVADDADVVVFITGQFNPDSGTGNNNLMLSTALWHATDTVPVFTRNGTGNASQVSYAVVEFTGANWNIQRIEHNYSTTSVDQVSITPVSNITKAFVHAQKRSGENGLHDQGHEVWISSVGALSFHLNDDPNNDVDDPSVHDAVVWVIENTQTGNGAMTVYQSNGTINSGGTEPETIILSIGGMVDPDNASIFVTNYSNGEGQAFPRGILAARIHSATQYELWQSDTGQNQYYRTEVVEWPVAEISVRQNYYRFYVDNDALTPTDPWPVGGSDLGENTSITGINDPLGEGERVRIRMTLLVNNATLPAETSSYKLQYARRVTSCSAISNGSWNDLGAPGSGAIWRGYDGPPVDGTEVASTSLRISIADVAGTYEEQNNSAVNPNTVDLTEDIEYDWHVEHNGAVQQSDYCFRMVESDGTELDGYNNYPTLRTTGYTPVTGDWRWYEDEENSTPTTPFAATNTAPIDVTNGEPMKLRIVAEEVEGASGENTKFRLQFSEQADFSDGGTFVAASSSCTGTSTWCYADGGGIDNATITTALIATADSCSGGVGAGCGTRNEFPTTTSDFLHLSNTATEFEFTIRSAGPRVNAVYYFRLYDVTNDGPVVASSSYPSVVTEGGSLVFTMDGVTAGQMTEGVMTDVATTPVSVPFGGIQPGTDYVAAYRLNVNTNATEGYQMFMYARQPMTDESGNEIPGVSADNTTPGAWSSVCSAVATGCVGYHAGDDSLSDGSTRFAPDDTYAAFSTSTLEEVMYSSQPSINDTTDIILRLQVSDLQPAGDYQKEIVFVSVPVY